MLMHSPSRQLNSPSLASGLLSFWICGSKEVLFPRDSQPSKRFNVLRSLVIKTSVYSSFTATITIVIHSMIITSITMDDSGISINDTCKWWAWSRPPSLHTCPPSLQKSSPWSQESQKKSTKPDQTLIKFQVSYDLRAPTRRDFCVASIVATLPGSLLYKQSKYEILSPHWH